jgi:hypothetical protein
MKNIEFDINSDLYSAAEQLANFPEKRPYRLLVEDATQEKLVDIMEAQGGCITVVSAEGGGIIDSCAGRYDKSANFDIFLKGHSGDSIIVDRIGRKSNYIKNPHITMMLTIQPQVLNGLMENASFRGRGLCGRFLYAICKSKVGSRNVNPNPIPEPIAMEYQRFVTNILSNEMSGTIRLGEDARRLRLEYQLLIERRLGDELEFMRDWGGKLVGAMIRIAALIHAAETKGNAAETLISGQTMEKAIKISQFLCVHATAAYQAMGADKDCEDAKYMLRRIKGTGQDEISKRDLLRLCKGKFKRAEDMDPAMQMLIEKKYIRFIKQDTGGRRAEKIIVNPWCLKGL